MPFLEQNRRLRWYHTWWGIIFLSFLAFVVVIAGIFVVITFKFWWQIKHGQQPVFLVENNNGFTAYRATEKSGMPIDRARLESLDSPYLGRSDAKLVIVEFVDFKCPNCQTAAPIMKNLASQYGGRFKFIARHFPVETLHPGATYLSEVAACAGAQDRFWQMHDVLFGEQQNLSEELKAEEIKYLAEKAEVDYQKLQVCLDSGAKKEQVKQDYLVGAGFGVGGTPTFFVNGQKVEGVVSFKAWEKYIKNQK